MPIQLQFVETIEEIRESLHSFNTEAATQPDVSRSLLTQTSYWVWDPTIKSFGPSKFVAFKHMKVAEYGAAQQGDRSGEKFDGNLTQRKLRSLIGEDYTPNEALSKALDKWGRALIPDDSGKGGVFDGVDRTKWKFITLPKQKQEAAGRDWSDEEIEYILQDYFAMLTLELAGDEFNKTAHRTRLLKKLTGRSGGSVEFKHCYISAVLDEQGLPYITGYKPRENYQKGLKVAVEKFLTSHPEVLDGIHVKLVEPPRKALDGSNFRIKDIEEPAPRIPRLKGQARLALRKGRGPVDWAKLHADQKHLGDAGEKFVVELEKRHLKDAGRVDLADKVDRISMSRGDGEGYDILSYDETGNPKYIEVKSTNGGKATPFFLSATELLVSEEIGSDYWLYRLFKVSSGAPGLYRVSGPLSEELDLEPTEFRARPKG